MVQVNLATDATRAVRLARASSRDDTALRTLVALDELALQIAAGRAFLNFCEAPVAFAPTYKLDPNSDRYDSTPKRRVPAWTDRVLFSPDGLAPYEYKSVPGARGSDHRPVYGKFCALIE